ncbi:MAG TPA: hypothetical protein VMH36_18135 [Alphaproteobacteria bacterium]|nr:hypothetical protein [Alphaproteobacteria bacterium]
MTIAAVAAPILSAAPAASELQAMASAASFLEVLEEEMLREAIPTSLPPPTFPLPLPGSVPPEYPWLPVPLLLVQREERAAKKRPPARGDKRSSRR